MVETSSADLSRSQSQRKLGPALLVFVLGMVLTLATWQLASGEVAKRRQSRFDAQVQTVQEAILARMQTYEQILLGGVGLINTLGSVRRDQWATYVSNASMQKNYPAVHGVGYAEYVPHAGLDAYLRRMAAEGMPQYQIRPAGVREAYSPVTYLEPRTERNLRAHGFDMWWEPTRHAAMVAARDSGQTAITARLKLASEPNESPVYGFLAYVPVYQTLPSGRTLKGFVNSPFRMIDLMNGILGSNDDRMQLHIYDSDKPSPDNLLYSSPPLPSLGGSSVQLTKTVKLSLHNRIWTSTYTAPAISPTVENSATLFVLVCGSLISLLLGALTLSITTRVRMIQHSEQHYFQLANFDSLTGLPNRAMFHARLSHTLLQAQRTEQQFALIFLDLDNFKHVNDKYGHESGDLVLKEVAARLLHCMRKADTVARLGGDEFVVILHEIHDKADAGKAAQNMLDSLAKPIVLRHDLYDVSVSMGIALYPGDAQDAEELLKRADRAMYASKTKGRNQFFYFTPDLLGLSFDTAPAPFS